MLLPKVNKPTRNSVGGQIIYQSIVPSKQSVILGAMKSNQGSNNSSIRKAKVRMNKKVNYMKNIDTSGTHKRIWPGNNSSYSERSSIGRVPAMLRTPQITDRCFGICNGWHLYCQNPTSDHNPNSATTQPKQKKGHFLGPKNQNLSHLFGSLKRKSYFPFWP